MAAALLLASLLATTAPELSYRVWTADDGLAQGSVYALEQTPDGYLWIATLDGLVRFDGVTMTTFNRSEHPVLGSNRILALQVDRAGDLWLGTEDGGVTRLSNGTFRTFGSSDGLPDPFVPAIAADDTGSIWATTGHGLARFDGTRWSLSSDATLRPGERPIAFNLGMSRDGGVRLLERGRLVDYPLPGVDLSQGFSRDPRGASWLRAGSDAFQRLENGTIARVAAPAGFHVPSSRWAVGAGASGRTWLAMDGHVHLLENGRWRTFSTPLPPAAREPIVLLEDREGSVWIGGETGLTQAVPTPLRAIEQRGTRVENNFYPVAEAGDGRLWAGSQGDSYVLEGDSFRKLERAAVVATALEPERDGSMLVAMPGRGITRVTPDLRSTSVHAGDDGIADLLRDGTGALWAATSGGVVRIEGGRVTRYTHEQGLSSDAAEILAEGAGGVVWIGGRGGLSRIENGRVTATWTVANGLPSDRIRALYEDERGVLWIGTYDGGLARLAGGKLVAIRKRDGLGDDGVFAIVDDGMGRFWMSSNRGLHVVERTQLDAFAEGRATFVVSRSFGRADGMLSAECNGGLQPSGIRRRDGTLVFPTQRGLVIVDPKALGSNATPPKVIIEGIATERRAHALTPEVLLQPSERRLDVRFTATTFVRPAQARFRYRLEGLHEVWVEGTERAARYAFVPPGSYVFRVTAANADGVWNEKGAAFTVNVRPAWWQTNGFRGGAALAFAGVIALGVRRQVSALKRRRVEQDHFARQLIESQEVERKRIAGELHDGIGQTLAVIRNRAVMGLRDGPISGRAQRQVEEIAGVATAALDEIRKVTHNLRPYQIDRLGLTRAIEALVEQAGTASEIEIDAGIDALEGVFPPDAEIGVYRIVQEALGNVLRHAEAKTAKIRVRRGERAVEIVVEDDGNGFDPAALSAARRGMGLSGIAERARILGGHHAVRSAPGKGTRVAVRLPTKEAAS